MIFMYEINKPTEFALPVSYGHTIKCDGSGCSSIHFSCSVVSDPLQMAAHQVSLSITNSRNLPKLMSLESVMPSNHLILCHPLLLLPSIFPSIRAFSNESTLRMRWPKYWSLVSASVLPMNTQDWSPFYGLVGSPCSPRDSQESSPTPQLKSINSLALSFLHSPTLSSIHNYWKNHSLD